MLQQSIRFVQSCVHDDLIGRTIGISLKLQPKPAMALNGLVEINSGHRIGEGKEVFVRVVFAVQALFHQVVLVFEHFLDAAFAHITAVLFFSINGIRKVLVISADCLGDGSRGTTRSKEMSNDFLACANFSKGPVEVLIQVYPERLLLSREYNTI